MLKKSIRASALSKFSFLEVVTKWTTSGGRDEGQAGMSASNSTTPRRLYVCRLAGLHKESSFGHDGPPSPVSPLPALPARPGRSSASLQAIEEEHKQDYNWSSVNVNSKPAPPPPGLCGSSGPGAPAAIGGLALKSSSREEVTCQAGRGLKKAATGSRQAQRRVMEAEAALVHNAILAVQVRMFSDTTRL